jgi:hypothetical protein
MKMETQTQTNPLAIKFPDLAADFGKINFVEAPFEELPAGMSAFAVMGERGDTKHIWDRTKPEEVEAARTLFDKLTKEKRYMAFRVTDKEGNRGEQMREFDPDAERMILVPQFQGG